MVKQSPRATSPGRGRIMGIGLKHPNYGAEVPFLSTVSSPTKKYPKVPTPLNRKRRATEIKPQSGKRSHCFPTFPLSKEHALSIIDDMYSDINRNESKMYKMKSNEIAEAGNSCEFFKQVHAAEFQRTLTYGEVEADSVADVLIPLLQLDESDVFYDLGCGSGKIPMQIALQTKCKAAKGIEIMHDRVEEGAKALKLLQSSCDEVVWKDRIVIVQGDISNPPPFADLTDATTIFINNVCFGPTIMQMIMDLLENYPNIRRMITLRKICQRHRDQRCALKGYACRHFVHPPPQTHVEVSWASNTSAFLYIRK